jgi:hypothetical protein
MRLLKINISLRLKGNPQGEVYNLKKEKVLIGGKENPHDAVHMLYDTNKFDLVDYDVIEDSVYLGKHVYDLGKIDFPQLSKSKNHLIKLINDLANSDNVEEREASDELDSILCLVDYIQDFAVDRLGYPQKEVFPNLEKEAEELGEALQGMEEDEFREWVKTNQPIEESDVFYDNAPPKIKAILDSYDENGELYKECHRIIKKLNVVGYTAEYGLDGQALFDFELI